MRSADGGRDRPADRTAVDRRTDRRALAAAWVATRAVSLLLFVLVDRNVHRDVDYYFQALHRLTHGGSLAHTLPEYPLPGLVLLSPQYVLAGGSRAVYEVIFPLSIVSLDAAVQAWLARRGAHPAAWTWLAVLAALGPLTWFRFDLVVAVLVLALVLAGRPERRGALLAAGTAMKLWPAALLPAVLVGRGARLRTATGFAVTGAAVLVACALLAGGGRLVSPVRWQLDRGLQVEAVPTTPLLLARLVAPGHWSIAFSRWTTYELFGPGVGVVLGLASVLLAGAIVVVLLLWTHVRSGDDPLVPGRLVLATTALLIVVGKVLSPQYILWLVGPLCALLVLAPDDRGLRRIARLLTVVAAMTQFVYPVAYHSLRASGAGVQVPGTLWLAGRNVLLVWFAVLVTRQAWTATTGRTPG